MEQKLDNERSIKQKEIWPAEQLSQTASNTLKHSQFSFIISLWKAKNHISTIHPLFWSRLQCLADMNGINLLFWLQLFGIYFLDVSLYLSPRRRTAGHYYYELCVCLETPLDWCRMLWPMTVWDMSNILIYTECTKHEEHLPNFELRSRLPSEQPQFVRGWTLQGVESVPQGCWPMLTPMLPTVVSSWMVDHSWNTQETVECEKPSSVTVLDTLNPCLNCLKA